MKITFRYQYICTIVHVLQNIKINNSANDESLYSVQQFRTLKGSVELITAIGIISCLLPGVGVDMAKTCPKALSICKEELTDLQVQANYSCCSKLRRTN